MCVLMLCEGIYKDKNRGRDLRCLGVRGLSILHDRLSLQQPNV